MDSFTPDTTLTQDSLDSWSTLSLLRLNLKKIFKPIKEIEPLPRILVFEPLYRCNHVVDHNDLSLNYQRFTPSECKDMD